MGNLVEVTLEIDAELKEQAERVCAENGIKISRKTLLIVKENIVFAIGVKLLVLALGAAGLASIWAAVFADVGVSVIAILNAVRILGFHKKC